MQQLMRMPHGDNSGVLGDLVSGVEGRVSSAQELLSCALAQNPLAWRGRHREQDHVRRARARSVSADTHLAIEVDISFVRMILSAHVC